MNSMICIAETNKNVWAGKPAQNIFIFCTYIITVEQVPGNPSVKVVDTDENFRHYQHSRRYPNLL